MGIGSHSKRRKKSSQKRSKKKTRSNKDKTKNPKRRHDSDDDSMANSSVSCYSSDDDYKSRKRARSRDRKVRKDRKKRVKRSRSMSESSGDDSPRVKKRKRSKKGKDSESRKKRHGKKRKRSPSVSSSSERSDDSEREVERKEVKERKGREKVKERSVCKRRERSRSKSRSPFSLNSESHSYGSEDRVVEENNPKRLKSVIVVVHEIEESEIRESNSDGNKAEIVFEHDDYPSKSNDSNDGVNKREASSFSHEVISEKPEFLDDSNKVTVPSDVKISEIPESQSGEIILNKFDSGVSTETASSNCNDLAAVLRQQALANFMKRQGKLSANNATDKKEGLNSVLKSSSSLKTDHVQHTEQKSGKAEEVKYTTDVPSLAKGNDASLPRRKFAISRLAEKYTAPSGFADNRTKLGLSTPRKEFIGAKNTWRRQLVPQESSQPKLEQTVSKDSNKKLFSEESSRPNLLTLKKPQESSQPNFLTPKIIIDKDAKQQYTSQEVSQPNLSVPIDAVDLGSSSISTEKVEGAAASQASTMVGHNLNEKTNEADGDSQFQQKTMSVMKGGEMVQVSYKVYIPKKAPALARRQLKR